MTAAAIVTARPSLIDRLLNACFAVSTDVARTGGEGTERDEDLRTALEAASMCQASALSAEYAHYLIDRHSGRMSERG